MYCATRSARRREALAELDRIRFLSHGTLEARDLEKARRFYEECLGLETRRTSPVSLMIRLNHNGLDVATREEVDACYRLLNEQKDLWALKKITRPADQHGTYSFYFCDGDDNWWEILMNPAGGYSWMFAQGRDLAAWGGGEGDEVNPNEFKPAALRRSP